MQLYTNEFTAELKAEIDRSPFTYEELAAMPEDARAIIAEQEAFHRQHPVTAIWRIATAGSQTRLGGVVLPVDREATMLMDDGSYTSVIVEGDCVAYPDGTLATIMTSAGEAFSGGIRALRWSAACLITMTRLSAHRSAVLIWSPAKGFHLKRIS